jgi:aspartate carbamoyltransferase catalytic subunit
MIPSGNPIKKSLASTRNLSISDVQFLISEAQLTLLNKSNFKSKSSSLSGKTLTNLFFEASTRTRTSFEIAGKRLGMDVVNVQISESAFSKGESFLDTIKTLDAMGTDVFVIRHPEAGAPELAAKFCNASVINAGDGSHQHPTQALADLVVLKSRLGDVSNKTILICGDIANSRVARSNAEILTRLGAKVRFCAPATLMPVFPESLGIIPYTNIEDAIKDVDAVMMLRLQKERASGRFIPSEREFFKLYGLNRKRLNLAKHNAPVLHPGPINRGLEIDPELADDPQISLILNQVEAGVAIRQAVLKWVCTV